MNVQPVSNSVAFYGNNYHQLHPSETKGESLAKQEDVQMDIDYQGAAQRSKFDEEIMMQNQIIAYQQAQQSFEKTSDIVHYLKELIKNDKENKLPKFNELFKEVKNAIDKASDQLENGNIPYEIGEIVSGVVEQYLGNPSEGTNSSEGENDHSDQGSGNNFPNNEQIDKDYKENDTPIKQDDENADNDYEVGSDPTQGDKPITDEEIGGSTGSNEDNNDSPSINDESDSVQTEDGHTSENNGDHSHGIDENDNHTSTEEGEGNNGPSPNIPDSKNDDDKSNNDLNQNGNSDDLYEELEKKVEEEIIKPIYNMQQKLAERQYELMDKFLDDQRELDIYKKINAHKVLMLEIRVEMLKESNRLFVHQFSWEQKRNIVNLLN